MFIQLKSGAMLNLFWLQDCFVGKHDKNIVIFYMVNGVKLIEEYDTESEAQQRVEDMHFAMDEAGAGDTKPLIVDELPTENISKRRSYLIKVSDDPEDGYQEWKYIEDPETGECHWEMLGIQKDYSYSKQDIDTMVNTLNQNISNLANAHNADVQNINNTITNLSNQHNLDVQNINNTITNLANQQSADVANLSNMISNTDLNVLNLSNTVTNLSNLTYNMQNNISNMQADISNISNILDWNEY